MLHVESSENDAAQKSAWIITIGWTYRSLGRVAANANQHELYPRGQKIINDGVMQQD